MTTCKISDIISPAFYDLHRQVKTGNVKEIVCKGGRGSAKSSYASIELILQLLKHKDCHAVVLRKIGNTLRNSVYSQCVWALSALGLTDYFKCTVSPMEITYIKTGQKICFFGLDDPGKIKSIKMPFGYIGILWFEEFDQFEGPEEIRKVEQSVLRGGSYSLTIKTFNPPAAARNFANVYALEKRDGKIVHHSDYTTTPKQWLDERFISDAEYLKQTNLLAYKNEYLGEVIGSGSAVFENLQELTITNKQIEEDFDRCLFGVDWGWYPDPWAFNEGYYNHAKRDLYIFKEFTRNKTSNEETARILKENGIIWDDVVMCDSAEPKSIEDYKSFGIHARGVSKPKGSVEYSFKWLQSLNKIYIDPERCPKTYKEFSEYEYERDKSGEVLDGYPDINNHHIDAVRYMTQPIWKKRGE